jgi:hypothetical protein
VSHFALTTQRILTECVRGVTFMGSKIDERQFWRWTPTTNQDVNDTICNLMAAARQAPCMCVTTFTLGR